MDDNYNDKMGDFFRKRFSDFDGEDDDWRKPDPEVKDAVLGSILSKPSAPAPRKGCWIGLSVLCLLLMMGAYVWHSQGQINGLKEVLAAKEIQLTQQQMDMKNSDAKHKAELVIIQRQNHAVLLDKTQAEQALIQVQNTAIQQAAQAERIQQQQQNIISQLKNTPTSNFPIFNNNDNNQAPNHHSQPPVQRDQKNEQAPTKKEHLNTSPKNDDRPIAAIEPTREFSLGTLPEIPQARPFALALPVGQPPKPQVPTLEFPKDGGKRFSVGTEYALLRLKVPSERRFDGQRPSSANRRTDQVFAHGQGLRFAYSPKGNNWWIRGGIRRAAFTNERTFDSDIAYDRSNESIGQNGERENQLLLNSQNPYVQTVNIIGIQIPQGADLEDGDLLTFHINEKQQTSLLQIPLGVEYLYGKGRLKGAFQAGMQWNRVALGNYQFQATAETRGIDIPTERAEVVSRNADNKQFFSTSTGLGLDYQIGKNWHANASLAYNYDFINNRQAGFDLASKTGTALKVGLDYRF